MAPFYRAHHSNQIATVELEAWLNKGGKCFGITTALLHQHFDPSAMREHSVYKIRGDEDESEFAWIQQDFEKLRDFYLQVTAHNEGMSGCLR